MVPETFICSSSKTDTAVHEIAVFPGGRSMTWCERFNSSWNLYFSQAIQTPLAKLMNTFKPSFRGG